MQKFIKLQQVLFQWQRIENGNILRTFLACLSFYLRVIFPPLLTWFIFMHLPLRSITTAHQDVIYYPASTALSPIAIMQAPTAAKLAACHGIRNPPTAAVTGPHRDPALRVVRTAVFIYKDKDRWRKGLNNVEKSRLNSSETELCWD